MTRRVFRPSALWVIPALWLAASAQARPWQGVTPGTSTRPQVQERFGQPFRTVSKHGKGTTLLSYQQSQAIEGALQANFCFDEAGVLIEITVFPDASLTKEVVDQAFGTDYQVKLSDQFKPYHLYKHEGLVIFFKKDQKTVESFLFTKPETK